MQPIRVLVVDDSAHFRGHLNTFLNAEPDIVVIGEAGNGQDAVTQAAQLKPDVVLMDVRMPDLNGLEATRLLRAVHPDARVIMLSRYDVQEYRDEAVASGANGYVVKRALFTELLPAIRGAVVSHTERDGKA
ncbi:MAG: response regulator transcription factor [Anaerolineae bacterium]